jgi:Domain of unknown function (DUF4908)
MRSLRLASMALAMGAAAALIAPAAAHANPFDDLVGQVFGHHKQPPPPPRPRNPQVARTGSVNLGDVLFGHHEPMPQRTNAPPVGRYRDDDGDPAFVLDRSSSVTLVRFEDSPEIWMLTAQPAPRGDMIYRNDVGEPMLRATRLGGLTLFTIDHPGGAPVALVEEAPPIRPVPVLSPTALLQHLALASAHASHAVQRLILFEAHDQTPQSASAIADAATVTAVAVAEIARRPDGRRILTRLVKVTLTPGHRVSVMLENGVLTVVVAPTPGAVFADIAGRPSSRRIELALEH